MRLDMRPKLRPLHALRRLLLLSAAAGTLVLTGCDSGDPSGGADFDEVAGFYRFTEYTFDPDAQAIPPINVLDTLNTDQTELLLTSDGEFQLTIRFVNGGLYRADGTYSVSSAAVNVRGNSDDAADFERVLLDREFTLRRDPAQDDILRADISSKRINPSAFSDRYAGVQEMIGTLRIQAQRR